MYRIKREPAVSSDLQVISLWSCSLGIATAVWASPVLNHSMQDTYLQTREPTSQCLLCASLQEGAQEVPQKRKRWLLAKAKQGCQQLQKLNLAFQDWTERLWKASLLCSVGSNHYHCHTGI